MNTKFLHEHLLPGQIGQFFVILSFVAAILASIAYIASAQQAQQNLTDSWKKIARTAFVIHAGSVFAVFGILFYLIFNHYFEYHYVWAHSSKTLPFKYLLSCFWEGQEGSFLLWSIWHSILGLFIIWRKNSRETTVMSVVSLVQIVLSSFLLGIYIWGEKIGSTPFLLLRHQMSGAPIFQQANYLDFVQDGNGLNPLLQNYWMVIHPPILFLGFASTLIPFAYAIAALWRNNYDNLIPSFLRWSIFSGLVLGTGIMMGGAWAYESLNFGGYWAWDPVENASLVPWIIMIAGIHTAIIYKATGYSLKTTLLFFIFSFVLVLYSTFLTRTGILGETSVHAFTGEGNSIFYHLLVFMFLFLGVGLILFFLRFKQIPDIKKEEEALSSREFWMFIGSLVLMISVIQITYTTSMPVWNKMFGTKLAITDPVTHYNKIQIWITLFVLFGTATIYYLKFKQSNWKDVISKLLPAFVIALILTIAIAYAQDFTKFPIQLFLFATLFSVIANLMYIIRAIKWQPVKWGGSIAHVGFGLMMLGILISGYNKKVISINRLGVDFNMGKENPEENKKESRENLLLFRNIPVTMEGYYLTYLGDTVSEPNHYYKIQYIKREKDTGRILEQFVLKPNAQINPKMGLVSSPDTRHYLTHDIFTYITSTVDKSKITDTTQYQTKRLHVGDSLFFSNGFLIFNGFNTDVSNNAYQKETNDIAVAAMLSVYDLQGKQSQAKPVYVIRNQEIISIEDTLEAASLYTRLSKIYPEDGSADIAIKQPNAMNDYVIMKAILFPYINVLWIGTVIMMLGFGISLYKRWSINK